MRREIANDRLTLADIPAPDAAWDAISEFALSYYCHTNEGSVRGEYNCERPPLGGDLDQLRAWLFDQQRCIRGGYIDDPDDNPALLAPLRQVIGAIRQCVIGERTPMNEFKRAPHDSLIEEAIQAKGPGYAEASARTFRTDALAILEALVAETDEAAVAAALEHQGFRSSGSHLTTFRALVAVSRSRRPSSGSAS